RLSLELRLLDLHADDRGETLAHVVGCEVRVRLLQLSALSAVRVDRACEGVAETREVRAAVDRVDVVSERVDLLGEAVVVLKRYLEYRVVLVPLVVVDQ